MNCTNPGIAFEGMALTVGMMDYYIQHYIFPLQFCLGVIGNSINLCVLLSSGMKNQANTLLSAMAFADLAFLLCMLPHSLASFSIFYKSIRFAYFYLLSKIHWVALANCFSTAATFLVLAVSLERFSGVRHPMHTRFQLRDTRLLLLIFTIYGLAFGLSLFHHLDYRVTIRVDCNKKRVLPSIHHISELNGTSPVLVRYVRIAKYVQSLFGVFVPVVAVAVLNVSLVYFLRKRQLLPRASTGSSGSSKKCQQQQQQQEFRYSDVAAFQRQERKVTATVIAIVSCFTITHLPTLGPVVWEHFVAPLVTASAILNSILVTGKVLNFFLFCSSSAHFRRRAVLILKAHLFRGRSRKKYSSLALSNVPTQTNVTSVVSNNMHGTSPGGTMCNNNAVFATAARCSRNLQNAKTGPNHSVINNHQNKSSTPTYRMPKQSTLSLRDALLRQQSGSECDDLLPPARVDADGIIRNGSQSARHSRTEFSN
uniref:G-protein coupled receptors family 1 profile domain-containing protein n=1 Tax=Globodera rostochiensis TaxID=31243 RepID=A0A914I4B7_GLORO